MDCVELDRMPHRMATTSAIDSGSWGVKKNQDSAPHRAPASPLLRVSRRARRVALAVVVACRRSTRHSSSRAAE